MKINWKVRLRNRSWLAAMGAVILTFVYNLLNLLDIAPSFTHDQAVQVLTTALTLLSLLGVVQDPTTAGMLSDSDRAMGYEEPWEDTIE